MVRVMATGVFDLLHPGHIHFLESARRLGDELIVVVATDVVARKRKHEPVTPQDMRRQMVAALKVVDRAVVGNEDDIYRTVEEVRPDIIALGYDQSFREEEIQKELERRGLHVRIVRLPKDLSGHDLDGTRKIIAKITQGMLFQKSIDKLEKKLKGEPEEDGEEGGQEEGEPQSADRAKGASTKASR